MIHTLTQQSCISIITLGILEDNGYSVNYDSNYINVPRIFYYDTLTDIKLIDYSVSDQQPECSCIKFADRVERARDATRSNIPISEQLHFSKIISYEFRDNFNLDLVIDNYISGLVTFIPAIYINGNLYKTFDNKSVNASKYKNTTVSFNFSALSKILDESNFSVDVRFEFEFYFGSASERSSICSINTIFASPFKWKDLDNIPTISYSNNDIDSHSN